jgi:hypothetical protein
MNEGELEVKEVNEDDKTATDHSHDTESSESDAEEWNELMEKLAEEEKRNKVIKDKEARRKKKQIKEKLQQLRAENDSMEKKLQSSSSEVKSVYVMVLCMSA